MKVTVSDADSVEMDELTRVDGATGRTALSWHSATNTNLAREATWLLNGAPRLGSAVARQAISGAQAARNRHRR